MADREKVIRGWERCSKETCPAIWSQEYRDCEYTIGLYCRRDILIRDTIEQMKSDKTLIENQARMINDLGSQMVERDKEIKALHLALKIMKGKCKGIRVD